MEEDVFKGVNVCMDILFMGVQCNADNVERQRSTTTRRGVYMPFAFLCVKDTLSHNKNRFKMVLNDVYKLLSSTGRCQTKILVYVFFIYLRRLLSVTVHMHRYKYVCLRQHRKP